MSLPGRANYDWLSDSLSFTADDDAGTFVTNVGVEVHAEVRVDVLGLTWESDVLGPYDLLLDATAMFRPYLLTGNPDRPATISEATSGVMVASVPIVPDLLVVSGNLDIDLAFEVDATLIGERIDILPNSEQVLTPGTRTVDAHGASLALTPLADVEVLEATASLHVNLEAVTTVLISPHLVMTVLGTDYEIAGIEVPVDLPPVNDEIALPPQTLSWVRPSSPGDSGSGSDGDTGGETSDEGSSGGAVGDEGCACHATPSGPPLTALAWVLLPCLRRRRRHS
jgi:MYXO-CTERM domain-containing protein